MKKLELKQEELILSLELGSSQLDILQEILELESELTLLEEQPIYYLITVLNENKSIYTTIAYSTSFNIDNLYKTIKTIKNKYPEKLLEITFMTN